MTIGNVYRTDLALEAQEKLSAHLTEPLPGLLVEQVEEETVQINRVRLTNAAAAARIGKPQGSYVTIEAQGLRYKNTQLQATVMRMVAQELSKLAALTPDMTVLVVGLGNWEITPDALGPKTVKKVVVTRHLQQQLSPEFSGRVRAVCGFSPGVLGITGIETAEIVEGVVRMVQPDLVIAIDALAAAASRRVMTTVQLADTGIQPGSGLGTRRFSITQERLGVPVLAVGVPTVVHASTIASDTMEAIEEQAAFSRYLASMQQLSEADRHTIMRQILPDTFGDMMVTPKEVDWLVEDLATIVAGGINQALHPQIDYKNIERYLH